MKKVKLLLLAPLLTASCFVVLAQTNRLEQHVASTGSKKDTIAVLSLLALGKTQLELGGDISKAISYGKKADSLSMQMDYQKGVGESALLMAACLKRLDKFEEAVPILKKAETIFEQMHSNDGLVRTYRLRGLWIRTSVLEKAITKKRWLS